jgi:hypothetical protein
MTAAAVISNNNIASLEPQESRKAIESQKAHYIVLGPILFNIKYSYLLYKYYTLSRLCYSI